MQLSLSHTHTMSYWLDISLTDADFMSAPNDLQSSGAERLRRYYLLVHRKDKLDKYLSGPFPPLNIIVQNSHFPVQFPH